MSSTPSKGILYDELFSFLSLKREVKKECHFLERGVLVKVLCGIAALLLSTEGYKIDKSAL